MGKLLEDLECQNHANCGDYCETEREREMVLCEDCLDSFDQRQSDLAEIKSLRATNQRLREALTEIRKTSIVHRYAKIQALAMREVAVAALAGGKEGV